MVARIIEKEKRGRKEGGVSGEEYAVAGRDEKEVT